MPGCIVSTLETMVSKLPWCLSSWCLESVGKNSQVVAKHNACTCRERTCRRCTRVSENLRRRGWTPESPVECTNRHRPSPIPVLRPSSAQAGLSAPTAFCTCWPSGQCHRTCKTVPPPRPRGTPSHFCGVGPLLMSSSFSPLPFITL